MESTCGPTFRGVRRLLLRRKKKTFTNKKSKTVVLVIFRNLLGSCNHLEAWFVAILSSFDVEDWVGWVSGINVTNPTRCWDAARSEQTSRFGCESDGHGLAFEPVAAVPCLINRQINRGRTLDPRTLPSGLVKYLPIIRFSKHLECCSCPRSLTNSWNNWNVSCKRY
jgi:hypothetical protein